MQQTRTRGRFYGLLGQQHLTILGKRSHTEKLWATVEILDACGERKKEEKVQIKPGGGCDTERPGAK